MKKYKLLKDLPSHRAETTGTITYWETWFKDHRLGSKVDNPKWFAPYVFTTEDEIDIYVGETYYWVYKTEYINHTTAYLKSGMDKTQTYFSTKEIAEQYLKNKEGSDLDVNKTCKTCANLNDIPCLDCIHFKIGTMDNYRPKELQFEVGKWYEHEDGALALFKEVKTGNPGFDYIQENDSYKWSNAIWISEELEWKLADGDKVKAKLFAEAKLRFPVGSKIADTGNVKGTIDNKPFRFGVLSNTAKDIYSSKGHYCLYEEGKWAEIVKPSKLMLGDVEVVFKKEHVSDLKLNVVGTKEGYVTFKQWLDWYEKFLQALNLNIGFFDLVIGKYVAKYRSPKIQIGCIEDVTSLQIMEITKAIKKL